MAHWGRIRLDCNHHKTEKTRILITTTWELGSPQPKSKNLSNKKAKTKSKMQKPAMTKKETSLQHKIKHRPLQQKKQKALEQKKCLKLAPRSSVGLEPPSREKSRKLEVLLDGKLVVVICGFKVTGQIAKQQTQCNDSTQYSKSISHQHQLKWPVHNSRKYYRLLSTWQLWHIICSTNPNLNSSKLLLLQLVLNPD